jgi:iron(III) transport system substrate-binding protein
VAAGSSAPLSKRPPVPAQLKRDIAAVSKLKGSARQAKLVNLAKAEGGEINVYTSLSSLVLKPLQAAWKDQFPDIKLNVYRASSEDVTAKVLAERKAHTSGADIIETNGTNMLFFQAFKDVLVPYTKSPYRAGVAKPYRFDTFTADRLEKFVVAWNTNLVPSGQEPRSFQALANAKWKGKLAVEPTDVDWWAALYLWQRKHGNNGKRMSAKKLNAMWRAIMSNAQLINGHTNQATALAAGQVFVIVSGHAQSIEQLQAKHAPIAFSPFVKPVVERPQGIGIAYRLPHPAGALLFYDWVLSPVGQKLMLQNGVQPARRGLIDNAFESNPFTIKINLRPIVSHYAAWQKRYESFTRLGSGG